MSTTLELLLLILLAKTVSSSSWICELPWPVSFCLAASPLAAWTTPRNISSCRVPQTIERMQEFDLEVTACATVCARQGCSLMVHDLSRGCATLSSYTLLPQQVWPLIQSASVLVNHFPNVALRKNVTASSTGYSAAGYDISVTHITDGDITRPMFIYHSISELNPWIRLDLEDIFFIKAVRILPRAQYYADRFINISIRAGVAPLAGPNFSSYSEIVLIPGPPTKPVTFFEYTLQTPICGRYVSVQRTATSGTSYLEIAELEVLAIVF